MSNQGSALARFRRALKTGNLTLIRTAAAELPRVDLEDALTITLLMERADDDSYERAAARWLARLVVERPAIGIADVRIGAEALDGLPTQAARDALRELCQRYGLRRAAQALSGPQTTS